MIPVIVLWASLDAGASVSASALATLGRLIVLIPVVLLGHELAHAAATRLVGARRSPRRRSPTHFARATSRRPHDWRRPRRRRSPAVLPWSTRIGFTRATALALAHRDEHAVKAADQAACYDLTDEPSPNRRWVLALAAARGGDVARAARLMRPVPGLLLPPFMHHALADAACPIRPTRAA